METEPIHRRIELQSPADLHYLRSNARRAARRIIDLHLPPAAAPGGGEEDGMRRGVEGLVEEYIKNTFALARYSISINGLEPSDTERLFVEDESSQGDEAYEPYDTRLASRLTSMANTHNELILSLANLRRTAPEQAARSFQTTYSAHSSELDVHAQAEAERMHSQNDGQNLDIGRFERWDDVEKMWERGTEGLVGLKTSLTETVARCERAVEVAHEIVKR